MKRATLKSLFTNGIIVSAFFLVITALVVSWYKDFNIRKEHISTRVIDVVFWNPSHSISFDSTQGAYKTYILTGIKNSDSLKLAEIKTYLKDFETKKNEINGVHIVFGGSSKYSDYVEVLNICLKEGIRRYIPYKNNLWIPSNLNVTK